MNEVWEDVFNQGIINSGRENRKRQMPWGILEIEYFNRTARMSVWIEEQEVKVEAKSCTALRIFPGQILFLNIM